MNFHIIILFLLKGIIAMAVSGLGASALAAPPSSSSPSSSISSLTNHSTNNQNGGTFFNKLTKITTTTTTTTTEDPEATTDDMLNDEADEDEELDEDEDDNESTTTTATTVRSATSLVSNKDLIEEKKKALATTPAPTKVYDILGNQLKFENNKTVIVLQNKARDLGLLTLKAIILGPLIGLTLKAALIRGLLWAVGAYFLHLFFPSLLSTLGLGTGLVGFARHAQQPDYTQFIIRAAIAYLDSTSNISGGGRH